MNTKRFAVLDGIRGFALLNMIVYHAIWDLVYLFDVHWQWYQSEIGYLWQQGICWTFIFLSGFCQPLGHHRFKRGVTVFLAGLLITSVTIIFLPQEPVIFGVLTLIGSCMLLLLPLERILSRCKPRIGFFISMLLFLLTRNINIGYLGFGKWNLLKLPDTLYQNMGTAYLGFPSPDFYSSDYFSLFPWLFLFTAGFFFYGILEGTDCLHWLETGRSKALEWLGRHSLWIYMLHQPVLYGGLFLIFS